MHKCIKCGTKGKVMETRQKVDAIARRRWCKNATCGHRWTTIEILEADLQTLQRARKRLLSIEAALVPERAEPHFLTEMRRA